MIPGTGSCPKEVVSGRRSRCVPVGTVLSCLVADSGGVGSASTSDDSSDREMTESGTDRDSSGLRGAGAGGGTVSGWRCITGLAREAGAEGTRLLRVSVVRLVCPRAWVGSGTIDCEPAPFSSDSGDSTGAGPATGIVRSPASSSKGRSWDSGPSVLSTSPLELPDESASRGTGPRERREL